MDGQPIDYSLASGPDEPESFSVDHAIPYELRPDLLEDKANFRPSHWICNSVRQSGTADLGLGDRSRLW